jgi:hypothetical protein
MANREKAFERHLAADKKRGRGSNRELTPVPLSYSFLAIIWRRRG